ncbi:speckle-type POZ protein-like [Planococcus citri]|uniref:speckle-type POZ protein-like n=1 Tax=Planococcus citri TaxID=170843 RepID=UPI0031F91659
MNQSTSYSSTSCSKIEVSALDRYCVVEVNWGKFSHLWTIKSFKQYHCKVTGTLESPTFKAPNYPEYKWSWSLFIGKPNQERNDYVGVGLSLRSDNDREILAIMKFSVLDRAGNELFSREYDHLFTKEIKHYECLQYVSKLALLDPDPNSKLSLKDDTLVILCELKFTFVNNLSVKLFRPPAIARSTISDNLSKGLERLLGSRNFVDVIFSVNGTEYAAHKSILAARSPVLEAMFKHDMQESRNSEVNISDISCEVFQEFLQYMYTDKTPDKNMVKELLVVADKYQVDCLKLLCEEIILRQLSEKNALDLLYFADLHTAERLRKEVIFYIKRHSAKLMSTQSWKNTILTHPHLFDVVNGVHEVEESVESPEVPVPSVSAASAKRKRT